MTLPSEQEFVMGNNGDVYGFWDAEVDISRTPSPSIPAKRMRTQADDIANDNQQETYWNHNGYNNLIRVQPTLESLGYEHVRSLKDTPYARRSLSGRKKMQTGCIPCL